jgi:hypothetical protein
MNSIIQGFRMINSHSVQWGAAGTGVSVGGVRVGLCPHPSLSPPPGTSSIRHKHVSALPDVVAQLRALLSAYLLC